MRRTSGSITRKILVPVTLLFLLGSFNGMTHVRGEESTTSQPMEETDTSGNSQTTTDTSDSSSSVSPADAPSVQYTIAITGQVLDENTIRLDWDAVPDAVNYQIYRDGTQLPDSDTNSFIDTTVEPNQTYQYRVEVIGQTVFNLGNGSATIKSLDTIPPNPPEGLKETILDADIIKIDWKSDPDAALYQIYRKEVVENAIGETQTDVTEGNNPETGYSEEVMVGTSGANSFTDKTAAPNLTYVYKIEALDESGNVSLPATINVLSKDTAPPTAPSNLRLKMAAANQNHLRWDETTDNRGVKHYKVYRSINGTSFFAIATTDELHYIDAMISTGDEYQYKITAVDTSDNESNFGNIEAVKMPDDRSGIAFEVLPLEDF